MASEEILEIADGTKLGGREADTSIGLEGDKARRSVAGIIQRGQKIDGVEAEVGQIHRIGHSIKNRIGRSVDVLGGAGVSGVANGKREAVAGVSRAGNNRRDRSGRLGGDGKRSQEEDDIASESSYAENKQDDKDYKQRASGSGFLLGRGRNRDNGSRRGRDGGGVGLGVVVFHFTPCPPQRRCELVWSSKRIWLRYHR